MKCNVVPCKIEDKPFVFISYAHSDSHFVFPVIEAIAADGYNIWFDHGIEINTTWSDEIANAIMESEVVVVFVTKVSMASSYVRSEVEFAFSKKIDVIPVYLEGTDILPPGLSLTLHSTQGIASNDPETIIFKLRHWLMRNFRHEDWVPVQSSTSYTPPTPSTPPASSSQKITELAAKDHRATPKDEDATPPEDEGNYWGSGIHGNKEEYEKYLIIKDRLEGKRGRYHRRYKSGIHVVSSYPFLGWLVGINIFAGITKILGVYIKVGMKASFINALLHEIVPLGALYWYYFRRYTIKESFLERLLPFSDKFQTMLYWLLPVGWLCATLNLEELKLWLPWIASLTDRIGLNLNYETIMSMVLPSIPQWIQSLGFLTAAFSGALLVSDMFISFFTEKK